MSKKISELTAASTPLVGTELVEIVQGGTSKQVAVSYMGGASGGRELLSAARTYYVRTDGSDSNDGLANTSGGAFLTIQKAVDTVSALDVSTYGVTIQVADGTYTAGTSLKAPVGSGPLTINGNSGTPANVLISTTSAPCFAADTYKSGAWTIKDLKVTSTGHMGINCTNGAVIYFSGINFGACVYHINAEFNSNVTCAGAYTVSGGGTCHVFSASGSSVSIAWNTVTTSGIPAFSAGFVLARTAGSVSARNMTFSGTGATGKRYDCATNGAIDTGGGGANYLPGNATGTTATGGQYA